MNGLVILDEEPQLSDYYRERVIGGPGAFLLEIDDFEDFARAMRKKLILEVVMAAVSSAEDGIVIAHSDPRSGYLQQHQ